MLAFLLIAQIASATPAAGVVASPTRVPDLGAAATAVSGRPKTLADLARERKLGKKGVTGGTLSVAGASGMPVLVAPTGSENAGGSRSSEERTRIRNAEHDVQAARSAVDDAAVRKGMTSEDAATARRKLDEARRELKKEREAAR